MPHRIAVLALDGLLPFELGIPQRIFGLCPPYPPRPPGPPTKDIE
ncbi:AraC family transcriptional regulator, partial [Streptomyces sp. NPDC057557]